MTTDPGFLQRMAHQLRIHCVNATSACNSGHPTSCSSIAEIMAVLFFHTMRYKPDEPKDLTNDRFIMSKGHAAPIYYAAWAEAGTFPVADLRMLRRLGTDFEGHPTPRLKFVDVATGSLGQGLSFACGMAYIGKYFDKANYRIYCVVGDGEVFEGQIWEAINFSQHYKLDNICLILDANRLEQTCETPAGHNLDIYKARFRSFGYNPIVVDGHNIGQLMKAFDCATATKDKPTVVICKTLKGKYFPKIEDQLGWHGKALGEHTEEVLDFLNSLIKADGGGCETTKITPKRPCKMMVIPEVSLNGIKLCTPPCYKIDQLVATRTAYGNALLKLAESFDRLIVLDCDVSNSTCSDKVKQKHPDKFIECYIGEQNMVSIAVGMACRDRAVVFASTFGAFFTRAFDNIRIAAISQSNANFCGGHCGISIGPDGASQMALEDIALFRAVPNCTVFYPSDAVSTERAVELAANTKGICYIRSTRPETPVIYKNEEKFEVGKAKVLRKSCRDKLMIIAAGITLSESLKAYEELKKKCTAVRIMDPFTIKPLDKCGIIENAKECENRIITIEDHYAEGGIGEAVLAAVSEVPNIVVKIIAVREVPRSGPYMEVLDFYELTGRSIAIMVEKFIKSTCA